MERWFRTSSTPSVRCSAAPPPAGIVCGLVAASFLARLLDAVLFEVDPHDPWALAVASFVPAQRAGRLDPFESLAAE